MVLLRSLIVRMYLSTLFSCSPGIVLVNCIPRLANPELVERNVLSASLVIRFDVRNAHIILGSCDACVAGKIVAAPTGASHSEPATAVGDHVYVDLIELQERSIGGYHWFLISVDEFSSILHIFGMKNKHSSGVESVLLSIVKQYNAQGHKVKLHSLEVCHCQASYKDHHLRDVQGKHGAYAPSLLFPFAQE